MVRINYCPSCGNELSGGSFICPACSLDIEDLFGRNHLLVSNKWDNSIEIHETDINDIIDGAEIILEDNDVKSGDEIVIVVPENNNEDEVVIDLNELGIDFESLDDDVNIIVQVEGVHDANDFFVNGEMVIDEANEWHFDDDPYGIVYYEFPKLD